MTSAFEREGGKAAQTGFQTRGVGARYSSFSDLIGTWDVCLVSCLHAPLRKRTGLLYNYTVRQPVTPSARFIHLALPPRPGVRLSGVRGSSMLNCTPVIGCAACHLTYRTCECGVMRRARSITLVLPTFVWRPGRWLLCLWGNWLVKDSDGVGWRFMKDGCLMVGSVRGTRFYSREPDIAFELI